jgi:hypothetical protein
MSQPIRWGRDCPNGHGELSHVREWCHDDDPECSCEVISECKTCGYQHYETCANAGPWDFHETPKDGDTWQGFWNPSNPERDRHRYNAAKDDWDNVPSDQVTQKVRE